ncbi:MAG: maleylpyruvate isomerase family mycothiol-dependent enzyme [Actinobacteria bacterium]|nr:maleylpyruvate isomerase family mycothiol-dependent enzyme [Actinomycetota bacterium]MCA1719604.1 maleylpyruvate isomerase family mycothiol-dependent enzyme [Actinomycetota bacterium]
MTAALAPAAGTARQPALGRATAMRLAATEYDRFTGQLQALTAEDWTQPTACPAWDVRALTCHVLGMAEMVASPVEQVRQIAKAKRAGGLFIDALTALQVAKHQDRTPAELVARMAETGPRAARGRRRTPAPMRKAKMKDQPVDETGTATETWALGYLTDVILTRDTWMHRSDIAHATGRPMVLTAEHDGVLVADVAAEWAQRHGQPCSLTLTGPAGGTWTWGSGGPSYQLDAEEFCRVLSGRGVGDGLLTTRVPF